MKNFINKFVNRETISYIIFGVLTTLVDYVSYCVLRAMDVNYIIANIISWSLAVIFAFITNKIYVFNSKNKDKGTLIHEIITFVSSRIFSLVFSILFIALTVTLLGMNDLVSKIISSIFVVIINYILSKKIVFNSNTQTENKSFFKENIVYFIAFIIPVAILIVIYYMRDVFPFGEQMYLRSDCYHQYAPFHKELWRKITSGESLSYSWNIGLGSNFTALYAYYLASPLNWIIGLVSESHIVEIMNAFIILKLGLSSATFSYYLSKRFNTKKGSIAAFSIFYALSSYICAFSWNLMWLDCILLFPLVVLGIEKLVKENKCSLYCISLALCILSNYYIAIMICIFSVLYFICQVIVNSKDTPGYYIRKFISFGVYSLIAGGFAAVLFIPAFNALSQTASGDFNFPKNLDRYFSLLQMLSRSIMNVSPAIFEPHDPNLYCTVAIFILLPLYWVNSKIEIKEKIGKTILVATLLVSFNLNIPNYIWHGLHFPNSLPCRESFIYIFLVLIMSYEAFMYIRDVTNKQLFGSYAISIALMLVFEQLFVDDKYTFTSVYLSILFITFYLFAFMLFRSKYKSRYSLGVYILIIVAVSETFINVDSTGFSITSRTVYMQDNDNVDEILENITQDDKDFYRIEKYSRRTKNDATWHGYRGASIFSSTTNAPVSELYGTLGLEESCNAYAYYGHTPFTEALLSVKYVFSNELLEDSSLAQLYTSSQDDDTSLYLYKNSYVLPLGFMVNSDINDMIDTATTNPFAVQNSLSNALGGNGEMFTRLDVNSFENNNQINVDKDMHMYVYCTTTLDSINVDITATDGTMSSKSYDSMTHKHIIDVGNVKSGSTVEVSPGAGSDVSSIQIYAYSFNEKVFTTLMDSLNTQGLTIEKFDDSHIKGTINAANDGLMFTSIPYDKGWTVYVDGEEVTTEAFQDAFIMIPVTAGEHTIEMEYTPSGLYIGLMLTILSIVAFVAIEICKKKLSKINKLSSTSVNEAE